MTDQTGTCVCCQRRDPYRGYACDPCRSKLRFWLGEIPDLWAQLLTEELAAGQSPSKSGRVSGTGDTRLPIRVDVWDLRGETRSAPKAGEDQVGHLPVWVTLSTWVRDWADVRGQCEHGPANGNVASAAVWLKERVDDMCDTHPAVDEFYRDLRRLHGALRSQLGLIDPRPEHCAGVPCRSEDCDLKTLYRYPGSEFVECDSCGHLMTENEYAVWIKLLLAAAKRSRPNREDAA